MTDNSTNEELRADELTSEEALKLVLKRPGMYGLTRTEEFRKVEAERDAALAAIERVRVLAYQHRSVEQHNEMVSMSDIADLIREPSSAEYLAALDGAPEPEWEYRVVGDHLVYKEFARLRKDWRSPDVEIERRPVSPWSGLPAEGESKP